MAQAARRSLPRARKILRYSLAALAMLMLVGAAALTYLVATFDPREYHDRVEALVKEKTGRTLTIEGDTALSFWPDLAVRMERLSLSERASTERFASVESVRVVLELAPLLSRKFVASELVVRGAEVRVTRDLQGRLNIADLLEGGGGPPRFDIGRLKVERSTLQLQDIASGAHYVLGDIAIETGRLAPVGVTPLALALEARDATGRLRLRATINGELQLDFPQQRFALIGAQVDVSGEAAGLRDIAAQIEGDFVARAAARAIELARVSAALQATHEGEKLKLDVGAARIAARADAGAAEAVRVALRARGPAGSTDVTLALPAITRSGDSVSADASAIEFALERGKHVVRATIATPLDASISAREITLPRAAAEFTAAGPRLPRGGVRGAVAGTVRIDAANAGVQVRVAGKVAESTVKARLTAAGFAAPVYTFAVDIDRLDLDRYLPRRSGAASARAAPPDPAQRLLDPLLDLPASGTVNVGLLTASGVKATDVRLVVR